MAVFKLFLAGNFMLDMASASNYSLSVIAPISWSKSVIRPKPLLWTPHAKIYPRFVNRSTIMSLCSSFSFSLARTYSIQLSPKLPKHLLIFITVSWSRIEKYFPRAKLQVHCERIDFNSTVLKGQKPLIIIALFSRLSMVTLVTFFVSFEKFYAVLTDFGTSWISLVHVCNFQFLQSHNFKLLANFIPPFFTFQTGFFYKSALFFVPILHTLRQQFRVKNLRSNSTNCTFLSQSWPRPNSKRWMHSGAFAAKKCMRMRDEKDL